MSIAIRPATTADMPWLLEQLKAFDTFFGSSRSLFPDADTAERILADLIGTQPMLVAENGTSLVGFICGAIHPHPYNPDLTVLTELFWWVAEEYRGSRAGLALLNEFVSIGKAHADWIVMTLESESKVDPDHLYRRGFRMKEVSYLLEVAA